MNTHILVADSSRARLFLAEDKGSPPLEVADYDHPEGRLHEGDLVSDRPGFDGGSMGQGQHVLDDETSARDAGDTRFAKQLVDRLEELRVEGGLQRLVLIAAPRFLGVLRDKLSPELKELLVREVDKDLTKADPATFIDYL